MDEIIVNFRVDITGLQCPIPLIKARRAIKNATTGQTIKFVGTEKEEISRKEILIAISNLSKNNLSLLEENGRENDDKWFILIKKIQT
ncbi:MAG: sulfurtransferase TusA family protein [Candidatus Hodarchaeales archaeon]